MLTLIVGSMFFLSCKDKKEDARLPAAPAAAAPLIVEAIIASPTSLSANIEIPGSILANESTEIHPEIAGRIVSLNVNEGKNVNRGALLVKLFDGDLQAQIRKLKVQLQIAEQTEQRQSQLLKIQGISQQDYDLSLLQVNNLNADMDIVRQAIIKTEIRAPFSGRLGLRNVSPGAYITPTTIVTTISQLNELKLQFNVPERYSSQIKNGLTVEFTVDGSLKTYKAKVIATEVHIEENTRSLAIRAQIQNQDASLTPGVFAKVKIKLGENENALLIPTNAIIPIGRKKQIFLYNAGKATPVEIVTGVRDSTNIQVLEGIKAGDTVITSAILFLRPGSVVEIGKIQ
ncbi:MAG: efflux RND transporter periplasmic adaptor subunit [Bacteroidota bacterium]|nr:efflux RND transporter periplasmic adaptor subunit [Bacteroidota bacterium]